MSKLRLLFALVLCSSFHSRAQHSILDLGLRIQKTPNLYNENGISAAYSHKNLKPDRLYFGLAYVSSRLGTASGSNAIKQDNFLLSSAYYFRRDHHFRPLLKINTGYFSASYGEPMFDDLPNSSLLLSSEAGISYQTNIPLKAAASLGYNFITGDGVNGPGTLYPVFYQLTLSLNVLSKPKPKKDSE
jgi:hypothetical protein